MPEEATERVAEPLEKPPTIQTYSMGTRSVI